MKTLKTHHLTLEIALAVFEAEPVLVIKNCFEAQLAKRILIRSWLKTLAHSFDKIALTVPAFAEKG